MARAAWFRITRPKTARRRPRSPRGFRGGGRKHLQICLCSIKDYSVCGGGGRRNEFRAQSTSTAVQTSAQTQTCPLLGIRGAAGSSRPMRRSRRSPRQAVQCRASLLHKQHKQTGVRYRHCSTPQFRFGAVAGRPTVAHQQQRSIADSLMMVGAGLGGRGRARIIRAIVCQCCHPGSPGKSEP